LGKILKALGRDLPFDSKLLRLKFVIKERVSDDEDEEADTESVASECVPLATTHLK
jgi:hypothetical protein